MHPTARATQSQMVGPPSAVVEPDSDRYRDDLVVESDLIAELEQQDPLLASYNCPTILMSQSDPEVAIDFACFEQSSDNLSPLIFDDHRLAANINSPNSNDSGFSASPRYYDAAAAFEQATTMLGGSTQASSSIEDDIDQLLAFIESGH